nr:sterol carrier protein [Candidatus Sigynarchaeota archaeon]
MLFMSKEWVEAYSQALNDNPAYATAAATWEGDFVFIVRNDATNEIIASAYFDLWHGKCRKANVVQDPKNPGLKPEFV